MLAEASSTDASDIDTMDLDPALHLVRLRTGAGGAIAFPSKALEHRVTPVTRGERRSLLLLCRQSAAVYHESDRIRPVA